MNPLIAAILALVEQAIRVAPALTEDLRAIFSKPNATPDDWQALREKYELETYEKLVPNTQLPPEPPAP